MAGLQNYKPIYEAIFTKKKTVKGLSIVIGRTMSYISQNK